MSEFRQNTKEVNIFEMRQNLCPPELIIKSKSQSKFSIWDIQDSRNLYF